MRDKYTYSSWANMKTRCLNRKHAQYHRYGGRGIKICQRWLESFENFLSDMGRRPKGGSLDRINNDGNYEPRNCRWATREQQVANRPKGIIDLTGMRFTRLLVTKLHSTNNRGARWQCVCDCGNTSVVRSDILRNGGSKSCGCLARELASKMFFDRKLHLIGNKHRWGKA